MIVVIFQIIIYFDLYKQPIFRAVRILNVPLFSEKRCNG